MQRLWARTQRFPQGVLWFPGKLRYNRWVMRRTNQRIMLPGLFALRRPLTFHRPPGLVSLDSSDGLSLESFLNTTTTFADLGLAPALLRALDDAGYTQPTPIQAQAIPQVIKG